VIEEFKSLSIDLRLAFQGGTLEPWNDQYFDEWALRVFEYQFESNPTYSSYCQKKGVTPSTLGGWSEIPPVPTSAFKVAPLISGDPSLVQRVFRTSGTTHGPQNRGEHHILDLELYRSSLLPNLRAHIYGDELNLRLLNLVPSPNEVPDSSLSFMLGEALSHLSDGDGGFFVRTNQGLDVDALGEAVTQATLEEKPIVLAGTAFAFVHWLDALAGSDCKFNLPPGSRILETGGFKGKSRTLSRPVLYEGLSKVFGVPIQWITNEYGMTELLSQFYEPMLTTSVKSLKDRRHIGPPWMRTRVLDPNTLDPMPAGEHGILCHYDLANAGSVMAILTEDLGSLDSEGGLLIAGRLQGAESRGCSLAMDELFSGLG